MQERPISGSLCRYNLTDGGILCVDTKKTPGSLKRGTRIAFEAGNFESFMRCPLLKVRGEVAIYALVPLKLYSQ